MKKSVKRFLSTVLALTMLCSCMAAMNITAFASSTSPEKGDVYTWYGDSSKSSSNDTTVFSVSHSAGTNNFTSVSDTVSVTIGGTSYTVAARTSAGNSNVTINVPSTVTAATLYVVAQSNSTSSKTLTLKDSDNTQVGETISLPGNTTSPYYTSTSISGLKQGTYTLSATGGYYIGLLALEVTEIGEAVTTYNYTITGSVEGLADTVTSFTVTNTTTGVGYDADVSGSNYTVTKNVASDPFAGGTFTVSASGYSCEGFTLSSGTDDGSRNITYTQNLTFVGREKISTSAYFDASNISASTLSGGEVLDTYFEYYQKNGTASVTSGSNSYGNLSYTKYINSSGSKRSIMFETEDAALVQVVFAGNGSGNRYCYIGSSSDIKADDSNDYIDYAITTGTGDVTTLTVNLSDAGTYYVYSGGSSIRILSINVVVGATYAGGTSGNASIGSYVEGTDSYILASVAESDIAAGTTLTIGGDAGSFDSTETVYQYVQIGNFVFAGSDVAYEEEEPEEEITYYIYGGKLTDSPDNAASLIAANATVSIA